MTPPPGWTLRPVVDADAPSVQRVVFEALAEYGLRPDPEGVDAELASPGSSYAWPDGWFAVLVDDAGQVRGTVGLKRVEASTVELRKMYLDRAIRGRGFGRFFLASALEAARGLGARRVTLETATVLREAVALYERAGFRRRPGCPHVCRCDVVMELDLDPGAGPGRVEACSHVAAGASSAPCDRSSAGFPVG